jgi:cardiolipin synthase
VKTAILICYLATWAFIPHLLLLKKRPSATLAWLWAIVFIPFVGALFYFGFGTDRLKRRRLRRRSLYSARSTRRPPGTSPGCRGATGSSCSCFPASTSFP